LRSNRRLNFLRARKAGNNPLGKAKKTSVKFPPKGRDATPLKSNNLRVGRVMMTQGRMKTLSAMTTPLDATWTAEEVTTRAAAESMIENMTNLEAAAAEAPEMVKDPCLY
jgi:hypothetical protein